MIDSKKRPKNALILVARITNDTKTGPTF